MVWDGQTVDPMGREGRRGREKVGKMEKKGVEARLSLSGRIPLFSLL